MPKSQKKNSVAEESISSGRGRSVDMSKRDDILEAASALFLENAAGSISMDAVAKKANVSKLTVYKHFADKRALFQVMIEDKLRDNLSPELFGSLQGKSAPLDLLQIAKGFTNVIYSKDGANMYRTVIAESKQSSHIPQMFYERAVRPVKEALSQHLMKLERNGSGYRFPNKALAANMFLAMLQGDRFLHHVLNLEDPENEYTESVPLSKTVGMFLKMFEQTEESEDLLAEKQSFREHLGRLGHGCIQIMEAVDDLSKHTDSPGMHSLLAKTNLCLSRQMIEMVGFQTPPAGREPVASSKAFEVLLGELGTLSTTRHANARARDRALVSHLSRLLHFALAETKNCRIAASSPALAEELSFVDGVISNLETLLETTHTQSVKLLSS